MPLSWNEIRKRATIFAKRWQDAADENSQAKPFIIDFFEVFGITDKRIEDDVFWYRSRWPKAKTKKS